MICLKNSQKKVTIDTVRLKADAQAMLEAIQYGDYVLSIWITSNRTMQSYNGRFRNKPQPTDILSFPYHALKPGERIKPQTPDDKHLGDLLISAPYVLEKYPDELFYPRLQKLLAHGISHLLGHDHDTPETDKIMIRLENKLLKAVQSAR